MYTQLIVPAVVVAVAVAAALQQPRPLLLPSPWQRGRGRGVAVAMAIAVRAAEVGAWRGSSHGPCAAVAVAWSWPLSWPRLHSSHGRCHCRRRGNVAVAVAWP